MVCTPIVVGDNLEYLVPFYILILNIVHVGYKLTCCQIWALKIYIL